MDDGHSNLSIRPPVPVSVGTALPRPPVLGNPKRRAVSGDYRIPQYL